MFLQIVEFFPKVDFACTIQNIFNIFFDWYFQFQDSKDQSFWQYCYKISLIFHIHVFFDFCEWTLRCFTGEKKRFIYGLVARQKNHLFSLNRISDSKTKLRCKFETNACKTVIQIIMNFSSFSKQPYNLGGFRGSPPNVGEAHIEHT